MEITSDWDPKSSPYVDLGLGIRLPAFIDIAVRDWHGYDIDIKASYSPGGYGVGMLTMRLRSGVTAPGEVPDLPIRYLVDSGTFAVVLDYLPRGVPERKRGAPSHERLLAIAKMYKVAVAVGAAPRKMIANLHGVSISTAGRWIALARAKELLSDADISAGGRPTSGRSLWDGPGGLISFGPDSWEGFTQSLIDGLRVREADSDEDLGAASARLAVPESAEVRSRYGSGGSSDGSFPQQRVPDGHDAVPTESDGRDR